MLILSVHAMRCCDIHLWIFCCHFNYMKLDGNELLLLLASHWHHPHIASQSGAHITEKQPGIWWLAFYFAEVLSQSVSNESCSLKKSSPKCLRRFLLYFADYTPHCTMRSRHRKQLHKQVKAIYLEHVQQHFRFLIWLCVQDNHVPLSKVKMLLLYLSSKSWTLWISMFPMSHISISTLRAVPHSDYMC